MRIAIMLALACAYASAQTPKGGVGGGGAGTPPHEGTFSAATSLSVTAAVHGKGVKPVVEACHDNATPKNLIALSAGFPTVAANGDVVIQWSGAKTGYCLISAGDSGGTGPAGPQGPQGDPGPEGAAGAAGVQGAQGPAGPQGDPGAQGPQGDAGAAGAAGAEGPQGPAGPAGEDGADANIAVTSGALKGDGAGGAVAVTGTGTNCVLVDGTSEPCGSGGGAPTDAPYLTSTAVTELSAEVNLGALSTGILAITVAGGVATPATALAGDFPTLNQNTTGTAAGLTAQYIDWSSGSGGNSIANKPTLGDAAAKNTGTSAGTVAAGDHAHTGVYEPLNANIQTHISDTTTNPHSVTKTQVGLGNVPDVDATNAANISSGTLPAARYINGSPSNDDCMKYDSATGKIESAGAGCGSGSASPPQELNFDIADGLTITFPAVGHGFTHDKLLVQVKVRATGEVIQAQHVIKPEGDANEFDVVVTLGEAIDGTIVVNGGTGPQGDQGVPGVVSETALMASGTQLTITHNGNLPAPFGFVWSCVDEDDGSFVTPSGFSSVTANAVTFDFASSATNVRCTVIGKT